MASPGGHYRGQEGGFPVLYLDLATDVYSEAEMHEVIRMRQKAAMDRASELVMATRKGRQEGLEEGRREGLRQAQLDCARRMLALGWDLAFISEMTLLSIEEVEQLRAEPSPEL